jgi:4-deoxy-L-threo-5-hexosulose-uronate ketol-isomerase
MKAVHMPDPFHTAAMNTQQLRDHFLLEDLFSKGEIRTVYSDSDRAVVGAAIPTAAPLPLLADESLRAGYFTERRELGILNIGRQGSVDVDGVSHGMDALDCLYVGRGAREIIFSSATAVEPAEFYLLSYPAHTNYPTTLARRENAEAVRLGSEATCNKRTLYKYIHPGGIKSCQLVMGFTQLEVGSAWNTMPPHTHLRRSEVYLYFGMPSEARVFHLMGQPHETRHMVVANRQAVVSPSWSIHSGVGTTNYSFCWGMGGENQAFDDMDAIAVSALK